MKSDTTEERKRGENVFTARRVTEAYLIRRSRPEQLRITNRPANGVALIRGGSVYRYRTDTTDALSDRTHVIFLPCGATYDLECLVPGDCGLINFEGDVHSDAPFCLETSRPDELFALYERIERSASDYARLSLLYAVFDALEAERRCQELPAVLRAAKAYMDASFAESTLTCASVAAAVNISEVYLRRLFAEKLGVTPHAYLESLRMEKAKALLRRGDGTVEEIAAACGYAGVYYFSAAFKKHTGLPPTVFRARERGI